MQVFYGALLEEKGERKKVRDLVLCELVLRGF
jgi:hypothetical protein